LLPVKAVPSLQLAVTLFVACARTKEKPRD
jgi:hypothetical protein